VFAGAAAELEHPAAGRQDASSAEAIASRLRSAAAAVRFTPRIMPARVARARRRAATTRAGSWRRSRGRRKR
jgi:hypothetical protein